MAKTKRATTTPSSYSAMCTRITRLINSPSAQKSRELTISIAEGENAEDWAQFRSDIAEQEGVSITESSDSVVRIAWVAPTETNA